MSYEIYKSVKQLKNGNFEVISTSNNDSPYYWHKWTMTFFNKKFLTASNAEKLACWMLYGLYVGDVFYQKKYKLMQAAAAEFMASNGYQHEVYYTNPDQFLQYAREFLTAYNARKACNFKVKLDGFFVCKKTSRRCFTTSNDEKAKIFKGYTLEEIKNLFAGYVTANPEFIQC